MILAKEILKKEYLSIIENNDVIAELIKFKNQCEIYELLHDGIKETLWVKDNKIVLGIYPHDGFIGVEEGKIKLFADNEGILKQWLGVKVGYIGRFNDFDELKQRSIEDGDFIINKLT